jgi:hypothetical protein
MAGCGCASRTGTPCSCGCGTTEGARGPVNVGGFVRPTFFADQLLCEDDLEAAIEYLLAKTRLHNRYLFGSGVVCGLDVRCDKTDSRSVIVSPGYALGCGDDIFVNCAIAVNVIELLGLLPAGYDCKPICPPVETKKPGEAANTESETYLLGVEYAEEKADQAMTYAVECGREPTCQPTRIKEGFRFALQCARDRTKRTSYETVPEGKEACPLAAPDCPCDDDSFVALALVTVMDCKITKICTTIRDYVLSGAALRMRLPRLNSFDDELHTNCCTPQPAPEKVIDRVAKRRSA